jgi:hypothetical protein
VTAPSGHNCCIQAITLIDRINYSDDLVICCRAGADEALVTMWNMMSRLKLRMNDSKTLVCRLPEEKFDFLEYTFGRCYSPKTGRPYWGTTTSKKRVPRLCKSISEMTRRSQTRQDAETLVEALNRKINGWANTSAWGRSVQPTERWTNTPVGGFASGCGSNTKSRAAGTRGFPSRPCIRGFPWATT